MSADEMPPVPELPPPTGDRTADPDAREWVVVECLDAFRDETGGRGETKVPVTDLAALYTRAEAWAELHVWTHRYPDREFSMRRVSSVVSALEAITRVGDGEARP